MQDPSENYWTYLKVLIRFVRLSVHFRLQFSPSQNLKLAVYTDTDWAGQRSDRKSTSGGVAMLYRGPVC
jgi:hypothetical protein